MGMAVKLERKFRSSKNEYIALKNIVDFGSCEHCPHVAIQNKAVMFNLPNSLFSFVLSSQFTRSLLSCHRFMHPCAPC